MVGDKDEVRFPDGTFFKGSFQGDSNWKGDGTLFYPDGRGKYVGEVLNFHRHGRGTFYAPSGILHAGPCGTRTC